MKTVVGTLAAMGIAAGVFLIGLYFAIDDPTIVPLLIGIGMLAQGLFTFFYLTKLFGSFEIHAKHILLAGQTIALTVGVIGGMAAFVTNINPPNGDYEYGPMTVCGLIALQAVIALYLVAGKPSEPRPSV